MTLSLSVIGQLSSQHRADKSTTTPSRHLTPSYLLRGRHWCDVTNDARPPFHFNWRPLFTTSVITFSHSANICNKFGLRAMWSACKPQGKVSQTALRCAQLSRKWFIHDRIFKHYGPLYNRVLLIWLQHRDSSHYTYIAINASILWYLVQLGDIGLNL